MDSITENRSMEICGEPACKAGKTLVCEVLVVGGGPSGLAACLQASELGLKTVLIETNGFFGGNGLEIEGVFAVGSGMQKRQGIDITFRQIIESECKTFNYHIDALAWQDMVRNSSENIDWLLGHGVGFSGIVDECKGDGEVRCFHWFKRRASDGRGDGALLTGPLLNGAKKLGAELMANTRGRALIMQDGKTAGLYAVDTTDETAIEFRCKVVILATGGFADDDAMMARCGYDTEHMFRRGVPGHNGDGTRMAVSAGAEDMTKRRTFLNKLHIFPLNVYSPTITFIHQKGYTMWINGNGERYANELCGEHIAAFFANAKMTQESTYSFFDSAFVERMRESAPSMEADIAALLERPYKNCYKSDTVEGVAAQAGMDPRILRATVERYNELCAKGYDEDFAKNPDRMIPINTPPYYAVRQDIAVWTTIGAVRTNRKFEAVNAQGKSVPGLYAVGVEGCELYRDSYTMNLPGSCNANNINSGRTAAKSAFMYIRGAQDKV